MITGLLISLSLSLIHTTDRNIYLEKWNVLCMYFMYVLTSKLSCYIPSRQSVIDCGYEDVAGCVWSICWMPSNHIFGSLL